MSRLYSSFTGVWFPLLISPSPSSSLCYMLFPLPTCPSALVVMAFIWFWNLIGGPWAISSSDFHFALSHTSIPLLCFVSSKGHREETFPDKVTLFISSASPHQDEVPAIKGHSNVISQLPSPPQLNSWLRYCYLTQIEPWVLRSDLRPWTVSKHTCYTGCRSNKVTLRTVCVYGWNQMKKVQNIFAMLKNLHQDATAMVHTSPPAPALTHYHY